jgi:hypothetical protein
VSTEFYRNLIMRKRPRPKPAVITVGAALLQELEAMQPGEFMIISDVGGRQFSVIATVDLEYVLERARMRAT